MLISGVGLIGLGYSLATRPTPAPPRPVFVAQPVHPTTGIADASSLAAAPAGAPAETPALAPTEAAPNARQSSPPEPEKLGAGMTIDVNTATAEQLQLLPGIGPSRAAAIIENRRAMGPFRTVEDLARIRGIGPATVEGVRPYVTLSMPAAGGGG